MATRRKTIVPANPREWSDKSQRSVSFDWTTQYTDREYKCWSCKKLAVFTAQDQQYTYEILKAPIDQQRVLCEECWKYSLKVAKELEGCEARWAAEKSRLKTDKSFLAKWLEFLEQQEHYIRYKPDTARKNMLRKLLKA